MNRMKRILCLALSLGMLGALAACGAQPQPAEPVPAETEQPSPAPTAEPAGEVRELAAPVYPAETGWSEADTSGLDAFTARSLPVIFADLNGQNRVYSPLNIYLALGMLTEISDGESRAQLMQLLGGGDIESLRESARQLFTAAYRDDEWLTVLPAASVWLREGEDYPSEPLERLAEYYFASAFSVPMGIETTNRALRDWINERTRHLLEAQAEQLELKPETVAALVTTLYFKGSWGQQFDEARTENEVFHAERGDRELPFMHQSLKTDYYRGGHFGAICLWMSGGAEMWLLLPDEDSSLQALIDGGEAAALLSQGRDWADQRACIVHLSLPKFDVSDDLTLIDALRALGVTDVFDPDASDFSPLSDERLFVSQVQHAARVKIDEKGCEAAAFTAMSVTSAAAPQEEPEIIDFVCDRPFLFAVTGDAGSFFIGAVNEPET